MLHVYMCDVGMVCIHQLPVMLQECTITQQFLQLQLLIEGLSGNCNDYNYTQLLVQLHSIFETKLRVITVHMILVNFMKY